MSQDSAMLTDVLTKSCDGIGVWPSYQVRIPGAMKARGLQGGTILPENGPRSAHSVAACRFKCLWPQPDTGQPGTFAGITARGRESRAGRRRHQRNGNDRTAKPLDVVSRWPHGPSAAFRFPADLAGQPALQSRPPDPGGRSSLGHDPDDIVGRPDRTGADRADAARDADLDAGRRDRRHV